MQMQWVLNGTLEVENLPLSAEGTESNAEYRIQNRKQEDVFMCCSFYSGTQFMCRCAEINHQSTNKIYIYI